MQVYSKAHTSTVAWSAYNWLAMQDGPRTRVAIFQGTRNGWDSTLTPDACSEALDQLVKRGYLRETVNSADDALTEFDLKDPKRLILVTRSRNGDGWNGWRVGPRAQTTSVPIDSVVKGGS